MPQLGQNVGYDPVTVTRVPSPPAHLNEEQVRPARSRQSSSTHPWHQAMEHAASSYVEQMDLRYTRPYHTSLHPHTGELLYTWKGKEKNLQNLDDKLGRTNV